MKNRIKAALAKGEIAYGTWAQMLCPEFCELAAASGFEFIIIDMEHGSFGIEGATHMIRAVQSGGASAMVRVPDAAPSMILKALDAGASAVLVPNVNSGAMAASIVAATRYAPRGTRSACPSIRASSYGFVDWPSHSADCERELQVAVLIETQAGLDNFDEIIAVPGIDIVALGPFDLSQAMGYCGDWKHPVVQGKLEDLVHRAIGKGLDIMPSLFDTEPAQLASQIARWRALGARLFAVSGDRFALASAYRTMQEHLPR
jgi:4-hydroxy-2-oxoheptanedioate aldolase